MTSWNERYASERLAHEEMWKNIQIGPGTTHAQFAEAIGPHWQRDHGHPVEQLQNPWAELGLPVGQEFLKELWFRNLIHDDADLHGYTCPVCKANTGGV